MPIEDDDALFHPAAARSNSADSLHVYGTHRPSAKANPATENNIKPFALSGDPCGPLADPKSRYLAEDADRTTLTP